MGCCTTLPRTQSFGFITDHNNTCQFPTWVKSLYHRAFKICSTKTLFNNQIEIIKSFMSWNGYPFKSIQNFLMKKLKTKYFDSSISVAVNQDRLHMIICLKFGFAFLILVAVGISFYNHVSTKYKDFFLSQLNSSLFMTLKNFHISFPTKTNFLLYLTVMLFMRSLSQVVVKHISA